MTPAPPSPLLSPILARLARGDAPDARWPDRHGEYWALCPFHPDRHSGSFSVSERGYACFACGARGGLASLAAHLGVEARSAPGAPVHTCTGAGPSACEPAAHAGQDTPAPSGTGSEDKPRTPSRAAARPSPPSAAQAPHLADLTLEQYAQAKHLDLDLLKSLGLRTVFHCGARAVQIPYFGRDGDQAALRFRHVAADSGKARFYWRRGDAPLLYGVWKLDEVRSAGRVILVEGESDTHTLWQYGLPALGVPGAACWCSEWAALLDGLVVYAWQEPDRGGAQFIRAIGTALPGVRVLRAPEGRKDVSDCHVAGDDVPALLGRLAAEAVPLHEILAAEKEAEAARLAAQAGALLSCPDLLGSFCALCRTMGLVGEERNAQILYLAVTSRLLERPVSVAVKGPSGGGKSFLVETVLKAFPPAAFHALSSMSERALAYSREPLAHRMLVLYEAAGLAGGFASYLLRSLLSEGSVRYETVERTDNGMVPRLIEREGPTGAITTTTAVSLDAELETRLLSLAVRDDVEQTRAVFASLTERGEQEPEPGKLEPWHALQDWLALAGVRRVTIPYRAELAARAHPAAVRLRRDFGSVLGLIRAHAILHQAHRRIEDGRIVATIDDYRAVHRLVADLVSEGVQGAVKPEIRATVEALRALYNGTPVTIRVLADRLKLDPVSVLRRVAVARRSGWIVNQETRRGQPAQLVPGDPLPEEVAVLPDPDSLVPPEGGGEAATGPDGRAAVQSDVPEVQGCTGTQAPAPRRTPPRRSARMTKGQGVGAHPSISRAVVQRDRTGGAQAQGPPRAGDGRTGRPYTPGLRSSEGGRTAGIRMPTRGRAERRSRRG